MPLLLISVMIAWLLWFLKKGLTAVYLWFVFCFSLWFCLSINVYIKVSSNHIFHRINHKRLWCWSGENHRELEWFEASFSLGFCQFWDIDTWDCIKVGGQYWYREIRCLALMDPEINSYFLSDMKSLHFYIFLELLL